MTSSIMEVTLHSSGENTYSVLNEIPTIDKLTDDAAVVLGFMLRSASDPTHQKLQRRSDDSYSHSFQFTPVKLNVQESDDSDNGDECDAAVLPDTQAPGILHSAITAMSRFIKHPFGLHHEVPDGSKQFLERTTSENEVILEHVADELARIADNYDKEYAKTNGSGRRNISASVSSSAVNPATPVYRHCTSLRDEVDCFETEALSPAERLTDVVRNCDNYDEFKQVLHENVGEQVDWAALARMFRLTQVAVQLAGTGSTAADQIQAFTLRYFRDRYAPWIVKQGGWSPVINSRRDDSELD